MVRLGAAAAIALVGGCTTSAPAPEPFERGALLAAVCTGCHAPTGQVVPPLAGYSAQQIVALMRSYATADGGTAMHRLARGYSDADVESLAAHLAR